LIFDFAFAASARIGRNQRSKIKNAVRHFDQGETEMETVYTTAFTTTTVALSFLLALGIEVLLLNAAMRLMKRAAENAAVAQPQKKRA